LSRPEGAPGTPAPPGGPVARGAAGLRLALIIVFAAGLLALGATAAYYRYASAAWVATSDASVTGTVVYVYPTATGTLVSWNAPLGRQVRAGDVLGMIQAAGSAAGAGNGVPVVSDAAGTVVQDQATAGQQVDPTLAIPLAALVDLHHLWIQANIPENRVGRVVPGQRVDVSLDAFPGRIFHGRVASIERTSQALDVTAVIPPTYPITFQKEVQRIPVRIDLRSIPQGLYPGMSAEVRIHLRP
jgi:multidrug resistance efflux pump